MMEENNYVDLEFPDRKFQYSRAPLSQVFSEIHKYDCQIKLSNIAYFFHPIQ